MSVRRNKSCCPGLNQWSPGASMTDLSAPGTSEAPYGLGTLPLPSSTRIPQSPRASQPGAMPVPSLHSRLRQGAAPPTARSPHRDLPPAFPPNSRPAPHQALAVPACHSRSAGLSQDLVAIPKRCRRTCTTATLTSRILFVGAKRDTTATAASTRAGALRIGGRLPPH